MGSNYIRDAANANRRAANEDRRKERERCRADAQERRSSRSFKPDNGTVDGQPANVTQSGDRMVTYSGLNHVGKVVTNDGENASYFRNDDGDVVVNDAAEDPYNSGWNAH